MKCSKCGFVSFDRLAQCRKCGAPANREGTDAGLSDTSMPQKHDSPPHSVEYEKEPVLPPQWNETIKNIKKELEEIEGAPVDRKSVAEAHQQGAAQLQQDFSSRTPELLTAYAVVPVDVHTALKGGFFLRLLAYVIDCALLYIIAMLLIAGGFIFLKYSTIAVNESDMLGTLRLLLAPFMIASTLIELFYFTYCHAVTGQTIGKWICGLKVVRTSGEPLGFARALLRWAGYFVSRFCLYCGFLWIAFSRDKQGWHDKIAGSYVIRV